MRYPLQGSYRLRPGLNGRRAVLYLKLCIVFAIILIVTISRKLKTNNKLPVRQTSSEGDSSRPHHYLRAKRRAEQLDHRYLSRLVYQPGSPNSVYQALPKGEEVVNSNYSTTIVMGRLSNQAERVQWVLDKLLNIQDPQIYIVDDPSSTFPHLEKNHGREVAVYMNHIIKNYDNLKDITFFWHNEEEVWHNNLLLGSSSVETINRMDRENIMRAGYVPSRCDYWPGCPAWIRFNPSKAEHQLDPHRLEEMFSPKLFSRLFPDVKEFPPYFAGTCCSQFAVTRDTIRSRPVETYQAILDWILEYDSDIRSGIVFEYVWPYIFLGRGTLCPTMHECYCKTYNFCIDDPKDIEQLELWNSLRTRREEVKWQISFMEDAREMKQKNEEAKGAPLGAVLAVEETFRPELERLKTELDRLVNITWEARESIIKHWKLPPPPVGW